MADGVGGLGRGQQRLARYAARPEAVAPHPVALDHGDAQPEGGRELGRHHASRAHPHDGQVITTGQSLSHVRSIGPIAPGGKARGLLSTPEGVRLGERALGGAAVEHTFPGGRSFA